MATPYYEGHNSVIYHGNCLDVMAELKENSIDAIVTDPPYFVPAVHYCTRKVFRRSLSDLGMLEHFYRDVFQAGVRLCKDSAVWYVFCDGQSYPVFYTLLYPHVKRQVPLVWDKQVSINGYSWRHQHELILFAEMPESKAIPTGDGDILACRAVKVDERLHPAQKPIELLKRLIAKSVQPNGVVFDPFCGSASTLEAASRIGIRSIGVESDERYCEMAAKRLDVISQSGCVQTMLLELAHCG